MRLPLSRVEKARGFNLSKVFSLPFSAQGNSHYFLSNVNNLPAPKSIEVLDKIKEIELVDTNLLIISHPAFINNDHMPHSGAHKVLKA